MDTPKDLLAALAGQGALIPVELQDPALGNPLGFLPFFLLKKPQPAPFPNPLEFPLLSSKFHENIP